MTAGNVQLWEYKIVETKGSGYIQFLEHKILEM